jgi:hypothetical protein
MLATSAEGLLVAKVKLKNATRGTMLCFNLEHPYFLDHPGLNGVGKPESLTIPAQAVAEVDEEALQCAEVKAALQWSGRRPPQLKVVG